MTNVAEQLRKTADVLEVQDNHLTGTWNADPSAGRCLCIEGAMVNVLGLQFDSSNWVYNMTQSALYRTFQDHLGLNREDALWYWYDKVLDRETRIPVAAAELRRAADEVA